MDDAETIFKRLLDSVAGDQAEALREASRRAAAGEKVALIVLPSGRAVVVNLDD